MCGALYVHSHSNRFVFHFFAVELHKTHDHAMYYKCVDIAQMLIVYEDEMALEEAEAVPKSEGFPSYFPSGLTPPMRRAVERFEAREHKAVAPPKHEVGEVEIELQGLMDRITKDAAGRTKKVKNPAPVSHKVMEEIVEDIVDYEPWMDDHGRSPFGIEFDDKHVLCTKHPELWLDPKEISEIRRAEAEKEQEDAAAAAAIAAVTKNKGSAKKDPTKKKKKKPPEKDEGPSAKKGIPAKKNIQEVDQVTQAASQMSAFIDPDDLFGDEFNDDFFTFGEDGDPLADLTEHNIS
jgi:transcription initiation factor TFIID subunit 7